MELKICVLKLQDLIEILFVCSSGVKPSPLVLQLVVPAHDGMSMKHSWNDNWQEKTEVLKRPAPAPVCPQILHGQPLY
jgi:hypothetical protein